MQKSCSEMLNQFGICQCCKEHGAYRNESVWCDKCFGHEDPCNSDMTKAFRIITHTIQELGDKYQTDDTFWNILLGKI